MYLQLPIYEALSSIHAPTTLWKKCKVIVVATSKEIEYLSVEGEAAVTRQRRFSCWAGWFGEEWWYKDAC